MNTFFSTHRTLALAALLTAAMAWLGFMLSSHDEALDRVRKTSTLRIGYAVEAPYALVATDGRVTGESPELARLVAARMDVKNIKWIQTSFDALIVELQEGRFDVIAAGMFITPERSEAVTFSEPTLRVRPGLLVPAGNPKDLVSYRGVMARPELRVAALGGSVEERDLRTLGLPASMLLTVPDAFAGRWAVESGAADALVLSLPTIRRMALESPKTLAAIPLSAHDADGGTRSTFYVAFAFSRENAALWEAWNKAQSAIIGTPAHLAAIAPFGFSADDLPRSMKVGAPH